MAKTATIKIRKVFKALPFEENIPNEETLQVMKDTDDGKNLTEWDSVDSYFKYIEENASDANLWKENTKIIN